MGFVTPEEAARDDVPAEYVRVVGVVVRGDEALVMLITNADGYPTAYEIDTARCFRDADGWQGSVSGNGNAGSSERTNRPEPSLCGSTGRQLRRSLLASCSMVERGYFRSRAAASSPPSTTFRLLLTGRPTTQRLTSGSRRDCKHSTAPVMRNDA